MARKIKPLPDRAILLERFRYDPETGELFHADGRPAFRTRTALGYAKGRIGGPEYYAHRVIWKMMTGDDPPEIDHRDGDVTNNRFSNLRHGSGGANERNSKLRKDSTSGAVGVVWNKRKGRWMAHIRVEGRQRYLGYFVNLEEAIAARTRASIAHGFSERHGCIR